MNDKSPRLSLCMIVKNEENNLLTAIQSVASIVDEIIVVDTGSSDQTVSIAKKHASLVIQILWKDNFSEARNLSIEEATGDWILILDADETLHPEDLEKVKNQIEVGNKEGFFVQLINRVKDSIGFQEEISPSLRLFRNRPIYRYSGSIHEQIDSIPANQVATTDIRIVHNGNLGNKTRRLNRGIRNMRILKREIARFPEDAFCHYNLGMEYTSINRYEEAIVHLEHARKQMERGPMWAPRLYKILAYCYIKNKQWEKATQILEEGILHFPDFTDLFYLKGMLYTAQKKFQAALTSFYTCLALGDATATQYPAEKGMGTDKAFFALGSTYESLNENKKAFLCYFDAFLWNPANLEAGRRWGKMFFGHKPVLETIQRIKGYLYDNPNYLLTLAFILADLREYSLCSEYTDQALAFEAEFREGIFLKALCYYNLKERGKFKHLFDQIQDKDTYRNLLCRLIHHTSIGIVHKLGEGLEKYPLSAKLADYKKLLVDNSVGGDFD